MVRSVFSEEAGNTMHKGMGRLDTFGGQQIVNLGENLQVSVLRAG